MRRFLISLLAAIALRGQVTVTATRAAQTPIIGPGETWASSGRFNPAAVRVGDKTVLLFRARDAAGTSRIGYADSPDGLHFTARPEPVLSPEADYEKDGGVEDPRLVRIDNTYYLTYTAYNRRDAQLCLATSQDLIQWKRQGVIMPAYKGKWNTQWTKSGAILPERINGKWWMYYMGTQRDPDGQTRDHMGVASSPDLLHWSDATDIPVLPRRPGAFDSRVMEPGPPPILTSAGILLLYNGADDNLVYGPGWLLFDARDPTRLIARAEKPFILPELPWEKQGVVPNVIFLEGMVAAGRDPLTLTGYYGAADTSIGALQLRIALDRGR
jgi:beta-1,2-mannosidase